MLSLASRGGALADLARNVLGIEADNCNDGRRWKTPIPIPKNHPFQTLTFNVDSPVFMRNTGRCTDW